MRRCRKMARTGPSRAARGRGRSPAPAPSGRSQDRAPARPNRPRGHGCSTRSMLAAAAVRPAQPLAHAHARGGAEGVVGAVHRVMLAVGQRHAMSITGKPSGPAIHGVARACLDGGDVVARHCAALDHLGKGKPSPRGAARSPAPRRQTGRRRRIACDAGSASRPARDRLAPGGVRRAVSTARPKSSASAASTRRRCCGPWARNRLAGLFLGARPQVRGRSRQAADGGGQPHLVALAAGDQHAGQHGLAAPGPSGRGRAALG
jgi:hypothetical protein